MEKNTQQIINLHKIDKKLNEIHEGKGDLPSLIKKEENKLAEIKESINISINKIENLLKEKTSFDISIEEFKGLIVKYNKQMFQVKNNKEYDSLLKEIDHIEAQNKEIVNSINNIENEITENKELKKNYEEKVILVTENLHSNKEELDIVNIETKAEEAILNKEKNKILITIEDKNFLKKYKNNESGSIIESISRGSCDNCFSSLPDQLILDIKKGDDLFPCPDCGIYLYYDNSDKD